MTQKKRILVLTSTFPHSKKSGAAPGFVKDLCVTLAEKYHIDVVTPFTEDSKLFEKFGSVSVYRYRYALPGMHYLTKEGGILANLKRNRLNYFWVPFLLCAQYSKVWSMLKKNRYDLIHAHWIIPQGWIVTKLRNKLCANTPILCTSHGGDLYGLNHSFWQTQKIDTLNQVNHITVVSQAMKDHCINTLNIDQKKIDVISMGIDLKTLFYRMPYVKRQKYSLLFVGRLVEKKGLKYLIRAMPLIQAQAPGITLYVIGDGPLRTTLEIEAKEYGCLDKVQFVGALAPPAVALYYNKARLLVMPSIIAEDGDQEGLGLVAVEAMGCKCPVVASDIKAIRDSVKHEVTGFLCKPKSPEDIAEKVLYVLHNQEEVKAITSRAQQFATEQFELNKVGEQYAKLIETMIPN